MNSHLTQVRIFTYTNNNLNNNNNNICIAVQLCNFPTGIFSLMQNSSFRPGMNLYRHSSDSDGLHWRVSVQVPQVWAHLHGNQGMGGAWDSNDVLYGLCSHVMYHRIILQDRDRGESHSQWPVPRTGWNTTYRIQLLLSIITIAHSSTEGIKCHLALRMPYRASLMTFISTAKSHS